MPDEGSLLHHHGSLKGLGCGGRQYSWWACRASERCYFIIQVLFLLDWEDAAAKQGKEMEREHLLMQGEGGNLEDTVSWMAHFNTWMVLLMESHQNRHSHC